MTRRIMPGVDSLAARYPELIPEWHPRNEVSPDEVAPKSGRKVWWRCQLGHEWEAIVSNRTARRSGCPYCAGNVANPGVNDFATKCPDLLAEWHPRKNGELRPDQVAAMSERKVWWQCSSGHEWHAPPKNRTSGSGCPYCAGRSVLAGFNDLATIAPDLAAQWHPTRNGDLTPENVTQMSGRKVWWRCAQLHEWAAPINNRRQGRGCPYCSGYYAWPGFNDLVTVRPDLALEWHPERNGTLTPEQVVKTSNQKVWWQCSRGHEWEAQVYSRDEGNGCPYCSGRRAWLGENDLATLRPDIAHEWHPTKNGDLTPDQFTVSAVRKVWWCCEVGHEWRAHIYARQIAGCPGCAKGGFDSTKDGWLYFLRDDDRGLLQVGISNVPAKRLRTHEWAGWQLIDLSQPMPGDLARQWERDILVAIKRRGAIRPKDSGMAPFDGHTESWRRDSLPVESLAELRAMVRSDED
jgi:hypothetical protein